MAASPKRYLQTGAAPSPAAGGAAQLATATAPVTVYLATAPVAGQVLQAFSPTSALWATPAAAGIVDDPVVKTAGFTAAPNTRYGLASNFGSYTVVLPAAPAVGTIVAFQGVNFGLPAPAYVTFNGNGFNIVPLGGLNYWGIAATRLYSIKELDVAFRFENGYWQSVSASLSSLFSGGQTNLVPICDANSDVGFAQMSAGDGVLGRVESGSIQSLRPYHLAHNLYADGTFSITDTTFGAIGGWLPGLAAQRANTVHWEGASDLIVRGVYSDQTSPDFRQDKVIVNNTGLNGTGTYRNIIWKNNDTGGSFVWRVVHAAPATSTDFSEYVQGPGETVVLRYNVNVSKWLITAILPSGRVDRGVTTTDAVATIIHAHQTNLANRVIAYKVQVEALETAGTPGRAALYDIAALFHRDGAGLIVQKGATAFMATIEDNAAWDVTFTPVGTTIEMKVTGDGTDTVRWRVVGNITEHG